MNSLLTGKREFLYIFILKFIEMFMASMYAGCLVVSMYVCFGVHSVNGVSGRIG